MSALYHVDVVSLEDSLLTIKTKVIHPDSMYIDDSIGFALHLICKGEYDEFPLGKEVSIGNLTDREWMHNYANGFIKNVVILEKTNEPTQEVLDDYDHPYWKDTKNWFSATLQIEVTHPDWLDHVYKNDSWDSAAYDPSSTYKKIEPILPSDKPHTLSFDYNGKGWMPIPSFLIETENSLPPFVYIPRYAENAYDISEKINATDINAQLAKSLEGKVIFIQGKYEKEMGICIPNEDSIALHSINAGSSGTTFFYFDDIEYLGIAGFRENLDSLGSEFTYEQLFDYSSLEVKNATISGNTISLDVVGIKNPESFNITNKPTAFRFLCSNFMDTFDEVAESFEHYPLSKAISYFKEKHNYDWMSQFFNQYADAFVKEYSIENSEVPFPDFDSMSNNEITDFLTDEKWPITKVNIEVFDPVFLDTFKDFQPYTTNLNQVHPEENLVSFSDPVMWSSLLEEMNNKIEKERI